MQNFNDLATLVSRVLPGAMIEEHTSGELVIYTGLTIAYPGDGESLRTMEDDEV